MGVIATIILIILITAALIANATSLSVVADAIFAGSFLIMLISLLLGYFRSKK